MWSLERKCQARGSEIAMMVVGRVDTRVIGGAILLFRRDECKDMVEVGDEDVGVQRGL